jgi:serine/threonine-protein kinase
VARTLWVDVSEEGLVYQVQELVDGEPLNRVLRSHRRLSPAEAARLGATLAAGLAGAHAAGVVHRDLKPSNVMVAAADPGLKLLDFGIARLVAEHGAPEVTRAGHLVGTPDYMAPEQLLTPDRVHPSIDVYAFGRVLFRAISGRLPDHATPRSVRAPFGPSPAVSFEPSVPAELAALLSACMAPEPDGRPEAATIATTLAALADRVEAPPLTVLASRWVAAVREETPRTPASDEASNQTTATMAPPEEGE